MLTQCSAARLSNSAVLLGPWWVSSFKHEIEAWNCLGVTAQKFLNNSHHVCALLFYNFCSWLQFDLVKPASQLHQNNILLFCNTIFYIWISLGIDVSFYIYSQCYSNSASKCRSSFPFKNSELCKVCKANTLNLRIIKWSIILASTQRVWVETVMWDCYP